MIAIKGDREVLERLNPSGEVQVSLGNLLEAINEGKVELIDGRAKLLHAVDSGATKVLVQFWNKPASGLFVRVGTTNKAIEDLTKEEFDIFKEGRELAEAWRWVDKLRKAFKDLH